MAIIRLAGADRRRECRRLAASLLCGAVLAAASSGGA
jgi:hypothetical protein